MKIYCIKIRVYLRVGTSYARSDFLFRKKSRCAHAVRLQTRSRRFGLLPTFCGLGVRSFAGIFFLWFKWKDAFCTVLWRDRFSSRRKFTSILWNKSICLLLFETGIKIGYWYFFILVSLPGNFARSLIYIF